MSISRFNKSTIIALIFFLVSNFSIFSQNSLSEAKKTNLPPGGVMPMKFDFIDYSYKLNSISSNVANAQEEKNFLKEFSETDLLDMKIKYFARYQYYMKANDFYNNLSIKVKSIYTIQELWYIYSFDDQLTNTIITIK